MLEVWVAQKARQASLEGAGIGDEGGRRSEPAIDLRKVSAVGWSARVEGVPRVRGRTAADHARCGFLARSVSDVPIGRGTSDPVARPLVSLCLVVPHGRIGPMAGGEGTVGRLGVVAHLQSRLPRSPRRTAPSWRRGLGHPRCERRGVRGAYEIRPFDDGHVDELDRGRHFRRTRCMRSPARWFQSSLPRDGRSRSRERSLPVEGHR